MFNLTSNYIITISQHIDYPVLREYNIDGSAVLN